MSMKMPLILALVIAVAPIWAMGASGALYKNSRWGFCFRVPGEWSKREAFDNSGVLLSQSDYQHTKTTIRVGALANQPRDILSDNFTEMTLRDYAERYESGFLDL